MLQDPISDRQLIDGLAEDLIGTSHYHHMPGMRVWDMNASYWTRCGHPEPSALFLIYLIMQRLGASCNRLGELLRVKKQLLLSENKTIFHM